MQLTEIKSLFRNQKDYAGKTVTVGGWVRANRSSKNFGFIVLNDGTFFEPLQVVYGEDVYKRQSLAHTCPNRTSSFNSPNLGAKSPSKSLPAVTFFIIIPPFKACRMLHRQPAHTILFYSLLQAFRLQCAKTRNLFWPHASASHAGESQ